MRICRAATLLVHPDPIVRMGLRSAMERHHRVRIVAESATGRDAVDLARRLRPALIILESSLPGLNGADVALSLLRANGPITLLMLSVDPRNVLARELSRKPGVICLPRNYSLEELSTAVDVALDDETSPSLSPGLPQGDADRAAQGGVAGLTLRQREVMQMVSEGLSTDQIARELGIRPKTVHHHRRLLMQRLDLQGIADLTRLAIQEGLSPLNIHVAS